MEQAKRALVRRWLDLDGGMARNCVNLPTHRSKMINPFAADQKPVVSKGNGECFLTEDVHTSLTGGGGQAGQRYPCVLCLNDQGGQLMNCFENITSTLRAQMNQHQPLILESNQDHAAVRSDGVTPTLPASMGMVGGYVPMVYENHGLCDESHKP